MPDYAVTRPEPAVCRLLPQDWQAYRAMRLAMLQESPRSFGSTRAHAAGFDEQLWRQRLADNAVMLAVVGTTPAGSAMYSESGTTDPGDCALFGMWVDPRFRGAGVGRALVGAVVAEFSGANSGLGHLVIVAAYRADVALLFGAVIIVSLFGIALFQGAAFLETVSLKFMRMSRAD
jgi:GNAT superfamily N-acetyltransferase